jgi:hypothetical protein
MPYRGAVHSLAENLPGRRSYPSSVIGQESANAIARELDAARRRLVETTEFAAGPDLREIYFQLLARRTAALKDRWGLAEARARSATDPSLARPYEDAYRQAAAREAIERAVFAKPGDAPVLAIPDGVVLADRLAVTLRNLRRIVEARRRNPSVVAPSALQRHWQSFAGAVIAQARAAEEAARIAEERGYPADVLDAIRRSNRIAQGALAGVRAARSAEEASRVDPFADVAAPRPPPPPPFESESEATEEPEDSAKPPGLLRRGLALAALTAPAWGSLLLFRR